MPRSSRRVYHCDDGNAEVAIRAVSPEAAARRYVRGGSWCELTHTTWINVHVWTRDGSVDRAITVTIHPKAPRCTSKTGHRWREDHVRGNHGGVLVREVCTRCALVMMTDTWATNPENGTQGHRAIWYPTGADHDAI